MAKKSIRPIRIEGNVAYVPLTKGYEAIIDAADVPLVEGRNWYAAITRRADGSQRSVYARTDTGSADGIALPMLLHRAIANPCAGVFVDHVDGDGLNNRKENLRQASAAQNQQNSSRPRNNTSGIKGVSWHKRDKKWVAFIAANKKSYALGRFNCRTAAAFAYAKASAALHKEFGRIA